MGYDLLEYSKGNLPQVGELVACLNTSDEVVAYQRFLRWDDDHSMFACKSVFAEHIGLSRWYKVRGLTDEEIGNPVGKD